MTAEEKAVYTEKAALEREEVAQQIAKLEAAGIDLSTLPGAAKSNDAAHSDGLIFPLTRMRKIVKLDPEVKNLSKEALLLVTKCTELMTSKLGMECVRVAQIQNRRGLLAEDVANVTQTREQFLFLKDDVKDLVREQLAQQPPHKAKKDHGMSKAATAAAANSKPLTAYFSAAKNS
jgi:DNA-directed RNA polymerase I subunit RPA43